MAQLLEPIAVLDGRGVGVADLQAALAAATDTTTQWRNTGREIWYASNGDAAPQTATLQASPTRFGRPINGGAGDDQAITIPAGEVGFFPFALPEMFNVAGLATVELDAITGMSVGVYRYVPTLR